VIVNRPQRFNATDRWWTESLGRLPLNQSVEALSNPAFDTDWDTAFNTDWDTSFNTVRNSTGIATFEDHLVGVGFFDLEGHIDSYPEALKGETSYRDSRCGKQIVPTGGVKNSRGDSPEAFVVVDRPQRVKIGLGVCAEPFRR